AEHALEVGIRGATLGAATQEEIQGDRIQQHTPADTAAFEADVEDQPQAETAATLAMFAPMSAHASSASPLASTSACRLTRKRSCLPVSATCSSASSPGSS